MPQTCTVCRHKDRVAIEASLACKVPLRNIVDQHAGISKSALVRHQQHVAPALAQATQAAEVCHADTLLTQVVAHRDRAVWFVEQAQGIVQRAVDCGEDDRAIEAIKSVAAPLREAKGVLELMGEVTGELQRKGQINVDARSVQVMADREVLEQMRAEIDRRLK
jgi:hypothetical protein